MLVCGSSEVPMTEAQDGQELSLSSEVPSCFGRERQSI